MGLERGISANQRSKKVSSTSKSSPSSTDKLAPIIGRVTDIVLNSEHPKFQDVGGYNGIGTIFFEENNLTGTSTNKAKSFFPQMSSYPLINELVLLLKLPNSSLGILPSQSSYYYLNMINLWNSPHHNAYPNPIKPLSEGDEAIEIKLNSPINESQQTFIEKENIAPLSSFAGDFINEGRWGNSIRLGSTSKTFNNTSYNNWSNVGTNGDPIIIIRNGQPKGIKNGFIPISEDINNDNSSIYITSTQKLPIKVAREKYLSYGIDSKIVPTSPAEYEGNQVIINSGRLVFNSKEDHILLSANKTISFNSNKGFYFDTSENFVVKANEKIKLGGDEACESLVLGDTLKNDLDFMFATLIQLVDIISYSQLFPGGLPVPDSSTSVVASNCKDALKNIKDNLGDILSKKVKTV
tara:strand:+ start:66 stop:1292 length:1227 start_codon:yes stop_codon:yes gene_type:complete